MRSFFQPLQAETILCDCLFPLESQSQPLLKHLRDSYQLRPHPHHGHRNQICFVHLFVKLTKCLEHEELARLQRRRTLSDTCVPLNKWKTVTNVLSRMVTVSEWRNTLVGKALFPKGVAHSPGCSLSPRQPVPHPHL